MRKSRSSTGVELVAVLPKFMAHLYFIADSLA